MGSQCWEIWRGPRLVALKSTTQGSARKTIVDYLRSEGCSADEIALVAGNAVSWRGEVYRAVQLGSE
jgi:hypothetical protein